jgi:hypothetical protein
VSDAHRRKQIHRSDEKITAGSHGWVTGLNHSER